MKKLQVLFALTFFPLVLVSCNSPIAAESDNVMTECGYATSEFGGFKGAKRLAADGDEATSSSAIEYQTPESSKIGSSFGVQVSDESDGKRSIRFLAEVSTLNCTAFFTRTMYNVVGDVDADLTDHTGDNGDTVLKAQSDVVVTNAYKSVVNGSSVLTAADGKYYVCYTMRNIPSTYYTNYFDIKLTLRYQDGDTWYEDVSTCHYANVLGATYLIDTPATGGTACVADKTVSALDDLKSGTTVYKSSGTDTSHRLIGVVVESPTDDDVSSLSKLELGSSVTSVSAGIFNTVATDSASTTAIANMGDNEKYKSTPSDAPGYVDTLVNAYSSNTSNLTSITFESTDVVIEKGAFAGMTSLKTVNFAKDSNGIPTVKTIGGAAFCNTGIETIDLPHATSNMKEYAFCGMSKLSKVIVHTHIISDLLFAKDTSLKTIVFASDIEKTDGEKITWFSGVDSSDDTTNAYLHAFYGCTGVETIVINANKKCPWDPFRAYDTAFSGFTNLKTVVIGNNVTSVDSKEFSGCTSLESVYIGSGVTSFGSDCFASCGTASGGFNIYYNGESCQTTAASRYTTSTTSGYDSSTVKVAGEYYCSTNWTCDDEGNLIHDASADVSLNA